MGIDLLMSLDKFQVVQETISQRQSIGQLVEPAPTASQLNAAFEAALTAPDHHRLHPWRFIVIQGEQRAALGQLLSEAIADLEADEVQVERVKAHPFRAPMIVICVTPLQDHPKVPHFEQILSGGAAIQNFILSLQAQGFSTMWRSGAVVESGYLKKQLGFAERDIISGIIYIGTAAKQIAARVPLSLENFVTYWSAERDEKPI